MLQFINTLFAPGYARETPVNAPRVTEPALSGLVSFGRKYRRWQRRRDAVRELTALDDRLLEDIGLSRSSLPVAARRGRY